MSNVFSCQQKQFSNPSLAITSCEPIARHLHITEEWEGNFLLSPFCTAQSTDSHSQARMEQSPRHLAHTCALPALPGNLRIQEAGTKAGMVRKCSETQLSGRPERRAWRKSAQLVGWRKTHAPFSSPFLLSHWGGNPGQRGAAAPNLEALKLILAVLFCWCLTSYICSGMSEKVSPPVRGLLEATWKDSKIGAVSSTTALAHHE